MSFVHGFPPLETPESTVLVLGTMPGRISLLERRYYAHPRNLFWKITGGICGFDHTIPYEPRVAALTAAGVAVWDVLRTCTRESSLDSDIDDSTAVPNDFTAFFAGHPHIRRVFFNGARAEQLYRRHVQRNLALGREIQYARLPSTSPANAAIPLAERVRAWSVLGQRDDSRSGPSGSGGLVTAVSRDGEHAFSKPARPSIRLVEGLGVEGDAHLGATVQHRSRVARDPTQPNLRQVHLIHAELHDELEAAGFAVSAGEMGENVTTRGVDLLGLPRGARLHLGDAAIVEVTGLRNPCAQLDRFQPGLMAAVLARDEHGGLIRKAGVMGIVLAGGEVRPGDPVRVELPAGAHLALEPV